MKIIGCVTELMMITASRGSKITKAITAKYGCVDYEVMY